MSALDDFDPDEVRHNELVAKFEAEEENPTSKSELDFGPYWKEIKQLLDYPHADTVAKTNAIQTLFKDLAISRTKLEKLLEEEPPFRTGIGSVRNRYQNALRQELKKELDL